MMRLAERQARLAHQPVGQIGRGGKALAAAAASRAVRRHVAHHPGHRGQRQHQRVGGVEDLFLVFLHVLGIGQRQPLHHREQRHGGPQDPPQLGAQQFRRIGVLLLRHDAAAPSSGPTAPRSGTAPRTRSPVLRQSATGAWRRSPRPTGTPARNPGPTPNRANWRWAGRTRGRPSSPGRWERTCPPARPPQRAFVHPRPRIGKARPVPRQHLDIGHHVMPPGHRLRGLQMGEARHHPVRPRLGLRHQRRASAPSSPVVAASHWSRTQSRKSSAT
jgi:hypothetical protein